MAQGVLFSGLNSSKMEPGVFNNASDSVLLFRQILLTSDMCQSCQTVQDQWAWVAQSLNSLAP